MDGVDGKTATDINQIITRFSDVRCDGTTTQAYTARYLMLKKPRGGLANAGYGPGTWPEQGAYPGRVGSPGLACTIQAPVVWEVADLERLLLQQICHCFVVNHRPQVGLQ